MNDPAEKSRINSIILDCVFNSDKAGPRNALIDEMTLTMDHRPTYVNIYLLLLNLVIRIHHVTSNINETIL